ncbi:MAG: bifunctional UDP-N-acetylglucosamine diphosphorylase/glucosamine-1-phosphate N-acetyltransferase GlmU [Pseudomonadota bacterium]
MTADLGSPTHPTASNVQEAKPLHVVVLAAGKGTRMRSARPKVLHKIAGRSLLGHVLHTVREAGAASLSVVIGPDMDDVRREALLHAPDAEIFEQPDQRGTGDAMKAAMPALERAAAAPGDVIMAFGDTPLLRAPSLGRLREGLAGGEAVAVMGFHAGDPTGYGRLLTDEAGHLSAIREHKDASDAERAITFCNGGVMGFDATALPALLRRIGNDNANGEYYLTDAVAIARADGRAVSAIACPEDELLGINTRVQLAEAEAVFQARARLAAMEGGVTMISPESVFLGADTRFGRDVIVEPNVFFGPGVSVGDDVHIRAHCHIEGASIGDGARIGPFARLRPGASLAAAVHIGNFVEVKNVAMAEGAKANHLAYLGDGEVGAKANVGAGTIFCNYDGFNKHRTVVEAGAFVGSNSALVAPVRIGAGAFVGSGSVISRDVEADALALERSPQEVKPGWAAKFRALMKRRKAG